MLGDIGNLQVVDVPQDEGGPLGVGQFAERAGGPAGVEVGWVDGSDGGIGSSDPFLPNPTAPLGAQLIQEPESAGDEQVREVRLDRRFALRSRRITDRYVSWTSSSVRIRSPPASRDPYR